MLYQTAQIANSRTSRRGVSANEKPVSLERFAPQTPVAKYTLEDLLRRGAMPVFANRDQVILKRQGQTATLDAYGRLTWA
jgi:3,4-dihydroxy-2-butanone 4-phosphate synthase